MEMTHLVATDLPRGLLPLKLAQDSGTPGIGCYLTQATHPASSATQNVLIVAHLCAVLASLRAAHHAVDTYRCQHDGYDAQDRS